MSLVRLFEFADERNELAHQDLGWLAFIGQFKSLLVLAVELVLAVSNGTLISTNLH